MAIHGKSTPRERIQNLLVKVGTSPQERTAEKSQTPERLPSAARSRFTLRNTKRQIVTNHRQLRIIAIARPMSRNFGGIGSCYASDSRNAITRRMQI